MPDPGQQTADKLFFAPQTELGLSHIIRSSSSNNQIQVLQAAPSQVRPGIGAAPQAVAPVSGSSISTPQHVQNVTASIFKSSDIVTKVTVTFQRNGTDPLFSYADVYVAGYNGNPQPVKVASGQSPVRFSLNNTGDRVQVIVQSVGNTGPAPLSTAPSATLAVPRTPLATTPTTSGNGTGGSGTLVMPAEFTVSVAGSTTTVGKAVENANTVWAGPSTLGAAAAAPTFRTLAPDDLVSLLPYMTSMDCLRPHSASADSLGMTTRQDSVLATLVDATTTEWSYADIATNGAGGSIAGSAWSDQTSVGSGLANWNVSRIRAWSGYFIVPTITNVRCWVGVIDTGNVNAPNSLKNDSPANNIIGFRYSTAGGDTGWVCITETDATHQTKTGTGVAITAGVGTHLAFTYDGTSVRFYVNRVLKATHTTNIPASTTVMQIKMNVDDVGLANIRDIGYHYVTLTNTI